MMLNLIGFTVALLAGVLMVLAIIANESSRRVGAITFYSLGRWRFTACRASDKGK